jgi:hypothetical protein
MEVQKLENAEPNNKGSLISIKEDIEKLILLDKNQVSRALIVLGEMILDDGTLNTITITFLPS